MEMDKSTEVKKRRNNLIKKLFSIKIYLWIVLLLSMLLGASYMYGKVVGGFNQDSSVSSGSVVKYIKKTNEHVFLNVGLQTVLTEEESTKIGKLFEIPLSKKKAIMILNYEAKVGIKNPVQIKKISEKQYKITVPKFKIIGFDLDKKKPYILYDRSGEILSHSTKEIDTGKVVTEELSTKEKKKYLEKYQDDIKESATEYYQSLFKAVDTDIKVEVIFSE